MNEEEKKQEIQEQAQRKAEEEAAKNAAEDTAKAKDIGAQRASANSFKDADVRISRMTEENDRREAIITREEELHKRKMLSGQTEAGITPAEPQFSDEEKASRARIKSVADASGASWGNKYE